MRLSALFTFLLICSPSFAGGARDFERGSTQYMYQADGLSTEINGANQTITVCIWHKGESDTAGFQGLIAKYYTTGNQRQYFLFTDDGAPNDYRFLVSSDGTETTNTADSASYSIGVWNWVCGWYDDTQTCVSLNGTTGTCSAKTNGIFNGTAQFQIGASETASPGNPGNAVDGLLAYAHVYNRSLSIDERNIIRYCPGSITSGLVAYFPIWGSSDPEMNLITASETMTVSGPVESTDGPPISLGCGGLQ